MVVESDSLSAVNAIINQTEEISSAWPLIRGIRMLLQKDWEVSVQHIYREANSVADRMAKYAKSLERGWHAFDQPPEILRQVLLLDSIGSYCNKMICNHNIPLL